MSQWIKALQVDPIPRLLSSDEKALTYFVRRDLLDEEMEPIEKLWKIPDAVKLVKKQQENGSWRYPGQNRNADTYTNYDLPR
jgi:hypothetical protein